MSYQSSDPIASESLGTADGWFRWFAEAGAKRLFDLERYLDTVYLFAPQIGLAAHKVVAQFIRETTESGVPAASNAWVERLNPAGIGVTDDSKRDWFDFNDGSNAAFAHLVHLCLYVFGTVPEVLEPYKHADPRLDAVGSSILGSKKTLASFGGSTPRSPTWSADPRYGEQWAATLNATESVFKGTPASLPVELASAIPAWLEP